jgi:phage N-6-adenine-methyltransferase
LLPAFLYKRLMGKFVGKFESARQDWPTPQDLFDRLMEEFQFEIDIAAALENTKCKLFWSKEQDALRQDWKLRGWLNPPYGDGKGNRLQDWVRKAWEDARKYSGSLTVMLIPARTNTKWFHKYCMTAAEVRFIEGRPKFGGADHGLPQPLVLVVFKHGNTETKFSSYAA